MNPPKHRHTPSASRSRGNRRAAEPVAATCLDEDGLEHGFEHGHFRVTCSQVGYVSLEALHEVIEENRWIHGQGAIRVHHEVWIASIPVETAAANGEPVSQSVSEILVDVLVIDHVELPTPD
jgi:hypothetical protein